VNRLFLSARIDKHAADASRFPVFAWRQKEAVLSRKTTLQPAKMLQMHEFPGSTAAPQHPEWTRTQQWPEMTRLGKFDHRAWLQRTRGGAAQAAAEFFVATFRTVTVRTM